MTSSRPLCWDTDRDTNLSLVIWLEYFKQRHWCMEKLNITNKEIPAHYYIWDRNLSVSWQVLMSRYRWILAPFIQVTPVKSLVYLRAALLIAQLAPSSLTSTIHCSMGCSLHRPYCSQDFKLLPLDAQLHMLL